jgi:hypothetical protein
METETDLIPVYCRDCGEDGFMEPWDGKLFGIEVGWVSPEAEQEAREKSVRGYKCKPCTILTI